MTALLQPTVYLARVCTPRGGQGWLDAPDGALAVGAHGVIDGVGARESLLQAFPDHKVEDHRGCVILPGLVDCHQHLCHTEWVRLIPDLFEWLDAIYAIEARFASTRHAEAVAVRFFTELARNGTTTCCVHGSYFVEATRAAFAVAARFNQRILMGLNAGDTQLPEGLRQSPEQSTADQCILYSEWNGANNGLLSYCFTVRPAYCASEELLHCIAQATSERRALLQTHLGEDASGRQRVLGLHRGSGSELDPYLSCGLVRPGTIVAHGVFLDGRDLRALGEGRVSIAHCPRANLLAGGRQMDLNQAIDNGVTVGLGTDLGAGKGLAMFRTMEDALKVTPDLSIRAVFEMATLTGAAALGLSDKIGSLEVGKEADFIVAQPKSAHVRSTTPEDVMDDLLSSLVFCGDDRDIRQTVVCGRVVWPRQG